MSIFFLVLDILVFVFSLESLFRLLRVCFTLANFLVKKKADEPVTLVFQASSMKGLHWGWSIQGPKYLNDLGSSFQIFCRQMGM